MIDAGQPKATIRSLRRTIRPPMPKSRRSATPGASSAPSISPGTSCMPVANPVRCAWWPSVGLAWIGSISRIPEKTQPGSASMTPGSMPRYQSPPRPAACRWHICRCRKQRSCSGSGRQGGQGAVLMGAGKDGQQRTRLRGSRRQPARLVHVAESYRVFVAHFRLRYPLRSRKDLMILNRLLVAAALLLVATLAQAQEPVAQPPLVEEALTPATGQPLPDWVAFPAMGFGTFMSSSQLTFEIVNAPSFRFTGQVEMDGRSGAFFADEIDDDTALGSDDGIFAWAATYVGVFAGFGQADNRIIDVDGFANWGNPGSTVDYDTSGFIGGALSGRNSRSVACRSGSNSTAWSARCRRHRTGWIRKDWTRRCNRRVVRLPRRAPGSSSPSAPRRSSLQADWRPLGSSIRSPTSISAQTCRHGWTPTIPFATARRRSAGGSALVSRLRWPRLGRCDSKDRI